MGWLNIKADESFWKDKRAFKSPSKAPNGYRFLCTVSPEIGRIVHSYHSEKIETNNRGESVSVGVGSPTDWTTFRDEYDVYVEINPNRDQVITKTSICGFGTRVDKYFIENGYNIELAPDYKMDRASLTVTSPIPNPSPEKKWEVIHVTLPAYFQENTNRVFLKEPEKWKNRNIYINVTTTFETWGTI